MANARDIRLQSDYETLAALAQNSGGTLAIESAHGRPPDQYVLVYYCRSIERLENDRPLYRDSHRVEIKLPAKYPAPFAAPVVKMLTPIYHPHVYTNNVVCMGQWQTSEYLDDFAIRLGALLQFDKEFLNMRDPANEAAVDWAKKNRLFFPTDKCTFRNDRPQPERLAKIRLPHYTALSPLGEPLAEPADAAVAEKPAQMEERDPPIIWRDM